MLATGLIGVIDECIQLLLPSRVFDPIDMLFNVLAAVMAVTASTALGWARKRSGQTAARLTATSPGSRDCDGDIP